MTEQKENSLSEKLNNTKTRLNELSKKVADNTKSFIQNTNNSIKTSLNERKEKREEKKQEKLNQTKKEISEDGLLDDVPKMITLPEFESERIEIAAEQNETMITIVEEMQRLSQRIDALERRIKSVTKHEIQPSQELEQEHQTTSPVMQEVVHLLGASLLWIVVLFGFDKLISDREIMILDSYPAEIPLWAFGAMSWSFYMLRRLAKTSKALKLPRILEIQTVLAVGITTGLGLLLYDETMTTVSNVWLWGTLISVALLLATSMIASVWNSTKKLINVRNDVEIIE